MDIYVIITQTSGVGLMEVRFTRSVVQQLWYKDGQVAYISINEDDFNYEVQYFSDVDDTATMKLELYDVYSDDLLYTYNVTGSAITTSTTFNCSTDLINIGTCYTTDTLISRPIEVYAEDLSDNYIIFEGAQDNSFSFGTDGVNFSDRILLEDIIWTSANTFNLYIRRDFDVLYGFNQTPFIVSSSGQFFELIVQSNILMAPQPAYNTNENDINIIENSFNTFDRNSVAQVVNGMKNTVRTYQSSINTIFVIDGNI